MTEVKNVFDRLKSRRDKDEERLSGLEDKSIEIFQNWNTMRKIIITKQNFKRCSIHLIEIPEGWGRERIGQNK